MKSFIQAAAFHLDDEVLAIHIEAAVRSIASVVAFFITCYLIGSEAYKTVAEATKEAFSKLSLMLDRYHFGDAGSLFETKTLEASK